MTKHIHGGDVYKYDHCLDFSANCNPLGTPQRVKKAIIDSVDGLSDYPRVGCGPLKEAIAVYEQTQKEYLICGNGAADLGTAGRPGGAERNGIRRKRKTDHFSGICVAEGRNDKAWPESISVRGKLYILSWTGRFI